MMFKPQKALTLLALAGLALAPAASKAAVTAYTADDLIMGIQQTGNTQVLLINLGQASGFKTGASVGTVISGLSTVLSSTFGSGWATDSTIAWGIVGTPGASAAGGDTANTLYASTPQTTFGVQSSPFSDSAYTRQSAGTQGSGRSNIVTMANTFAGLTSVATGTGTNVAAALQATSTTGGWFSQNPLGAGGSSFSYFNSLEGSFANGVSNSALDLYRMQVYNTAPAGSIGDAGAYIGTFQLSPSGSVSFSTSPGAVPEPTRAVLFGAGLAGLMLRRRRAVRSTVAA